MEDTVADHDASIRAVQSKVRALEYRAEDAENRSRRNNPRIVGLPDGVGGRLLVLFAEDHLRSLMPTAQLSQYFAVKELTEFRPGLKGPLLASSYSGYLISGIGMSCPGPLVLQANYPTATASAVSRLQYGDPLLRLG